MSEYKVDFDIPAMKKDQIKTIVVDIVAAVIILGLIVLFSYLGAGPLPALLIPAILLFFVLVYLVVMLSCGISRYLRYARKHSVDLVTFTSDTIKIDNDEYKRGDKDISYKIERGLKHDHLNLTGCLLVVSNPKDASRKVYWIGPKKHFDSEFKREMFFDSIYEEEAKCLYLDDAQESGETGDVEFTIHFPYKDSIMSRLYVSLLMIGCGVGFLVATSHGINLVARHHHEITSQGDALLQNFFGILFIIAPIVNDLIPFFNADTTLKTVSIKNDTITFNGEYVYHVEGLSIDIYRGADRQLYVAAGYRVYWAGSSHDDESYYSVRCLRNNLRRVCPWVLANDRGV